ncbi:hypothetical protein [Listeria fleischmannii]|uniref:Uncharacterized protein n=1 Tax=Listeria fleischmannii FSL S10-1203 TaxID=1265822 RepID=W7D4Q2_9LIST|nr:hypothetical protein [Listeria fleischmannii]EUJ44182.1 hypothetical protein MCOL2_19996 [Listeria fleischmannii FSL S10-1203]
MGIRDIFYPKLKKTQYYFVSFVFGQPVVFGQVTVEIDTESYQPLTVERMEEIKRRINLSYPQAIILTIIPLENEEGPS